MQHADQLRRLSALLDEALDLPLTERTRWLDELAEDDTHLAGTLREMLARHADDSGAPVLDTSAASRLLADPVRYDDPGPHAGQAIGPYRLLSPIGQGGMGEVWLASHDDSGPDRRVALKLPVLSTRRGVLLKRFERERDILASLAHPNIARLYDAGVSEDGQPYLALEPVDGLAITRYAEERRLDTASRVRLMLQVMQAVQHAHARLVIHRDLKPSNVLVTADGRAMLLDFGIAKLLQDDKGEAAETALTREGGRAMTLDYAAPEQLRGEPISTATDVWALGVLGYELLSGQRPFRGGRRGEVEQRVLEADPPRLTPSTTTTNGARRSRLQELDTIFGKALKKRPEERYATVASFADDLNRWLRDEPVLARPDSPWYRASKLMVRHRGAVATSVAVLVAIVGAAGVALWQSQVAREQARVARTEAATARAVQDFLEGILRSNRSDQADPMAARDKTARQLLAEAAGRISQSLDDEPQAKLRLLATLADMLEQVELRDLALRMREQRAELIGRMTGEASRAHAEAVLEIARRMFLQGRRAEAGVLLDQAKAMHRRNPALGGNTLATLALLQGVWAKGGATPASAIPEIAALLGETTTAASTLDHLLAHLTLAGLQRGGGDTDGARRTIQAAWQSLARLDTEPLTASQRVRIDLARRAVSAGRDDEAMDALDSIDPLARRRSSGPSPFEHLLMPDAYRLTVARTEDLLNVYRKLNARSETPRDEMMGTLARMELGRAHLLAGQISEAQRVAADLEKSADRMQWMVLQTRAEIAIETGQFDDARRALAALRERPERASRPARLLGNLYERRETRMQIDEVFARSDANAARTLFEQLVPMRPTGFDADVAAFEARLLLLEGKPTEAVALAHAAVDTMRIRRPSPARIQLHQTLGDALVATGQPAEAIPVLETGLALVPSVYEPEISPRVALLHLALAEARFAAGDRPGAQHALATGRAILAKHSLLGPQYLGPLARASARVGAG